MSRPALSPSPADAARAMALLMAKRKASARGAVRTHADGRVYVDLGEDARVWSFPLEHRSIPLTRELADEVLTDIRTGLEQGRELADIIADYQPRLARPNLVCTRLERWLEVKRQEVTAGDRAEYYVRELERWAKPRGHFSWWDGKSIREVTEAALEDRSHWLAERRTPQERLLSPATRSRVLGGFHAFLTWLYRRRELREMPRTYPWPKVPEREPRVLSISDQEAVLAAIDESDRGIFLALAQMGLRPSEARALDVSDYNDGWIAVDKRMNGPNRTAEVRRGTKGGASKTLPVSEELREWIGRNIDPAGRLIGAPLFPNVRTGQRWSQWALMDRWKIAAESVGVFGVSLYPGTKHTMATDAIRRGVPERSVQAFLGHADVRSTRRYARLSREAFVGVLRKSDSRSGASQARSPITPTNVERNHRVMASPTGFEPVLSP